MQLLKIRKSDGVVVQAVRVGRNAVQPEPDEEFDYEVRSDEIATDKVMRRAGNGRFYAVAKKDLIQPRHILAVREKEFTATEGWGSADRPLTDEVIEWRAYRQALRDITENGRTVKAMVKAFPIRPDGTDAISEYR